MAQSIGISRQPAGGQPHADSSSHSIDLSPRRLLSCGVVAGPLFVVVGVAQILTVPGFDLRRHALSLLEAGPYGGIQMANFVVTGLLLLAYAASVRRTLHRGPGAMLAPLLIALCGAGFIGGAIFHPDPGLGFPPGTPDTIPTTMTTNALLHLVFGSVAFLALIAACFALAQHFSASGQRREATSLRIAGVIFAAGLIESLAGGPVGSLVLFVAASVALVAVALAAASLRSSQAVPAD
jgi:Protein of unknown function (DUF998)